MDLTASETAVRYAPKSNDELLSLHKSGALTDVGYERLESEMTRRAMTIPARSATGEALLAAEETFRRQTLLAHWRGEARLASAYWLVGVVGGWLIGGIVVGTAALAPRFLLLTVALLLIFVVFASVSIWRCAKNTSWIAWGYVARGIVVLNAVGFLFLVLRLISGGA
jgi:hypothetical protein